MHSDVMYPKIPPYEKSEEEWKENQPVNGLRANKAAEGTNLLPSLPQRSLGKRLAFLLSTFWQLEEQRRT